METKLTIFKVCPNCGSTEYLENYPTPGATACVACMHEMTEIPLKELSYYPESMNCSSCEKEKEQVETLYEDDFVLVIKCRTCKKIEGYCLDPESQYNNEDLDESYFSGKDIAKAKKEGKFTIEI